MDFPLISEFITMLICVYLLVVGAPEHISVSLQKKRNSIANALKLRFVCISHQYKLYISDERNASQLRVRSY